MRILSFLVCFLTLHLAQAQCPMPINSPAGTLDSCFKPPVSFLEVKAVGAAPDGKVLIAGYGTVARLNEDGSLDSTFKICDDLLVMPSEFLFLSDGKILVAGEFSSYNGYNSVGLVRLKASGEIDSTFRANPYQNGYDVIAIRRVFPLADGRLQVKPEYIRFPNLSHGCTVRLLPNGSLDTSFHTQTIFSYDPQLMALLPDGKMITCDISYTESIMTVRRINANGTPDASFNNGSVWQYSRFGPSYAPALYGHALSDGRVLLAGGFDRYNGVHCGPMIRLLPDGRIDSSFVMDTVHASSVSGFVVRPNGKIIALGYFKTWRGNVFSRVAQFHPDGSMDTSFTQFGGSSDIVQTIALTSNNKLLAGGSRLLYQSTSVPNAIRIFLDGGIPTEEASTLARASLQIIPNPASGQITLSSEEPIDHTDLIGPDGRRIAIQLQANTFSVTHLAPGLYTVITQTRSRKTLRSRLAVVR